MKRFMTGGVTNGIKTSGSEEKLCRSVPICSVFSKVIKFLLIFCLERDNGQQAGFWLFVVVVVVISKS